MFAVFGACVVLATGFQFSNGQEKTYCEQNPEPASLVSQEGDHCFFFDNSSGMLKPKGNNFEFDKSVAERACAENAAHLPKFSKNMTTAERKAFYNLADKSFPSSQMVLWPTICKVINSSGDNVLLDCGLGQQLVPRDNLFNDSKMWTHRDPVCYDKPACVTYYIAKAGLHTVDSTSNLFPKNDTVPLMCHQLKSALTTTSSTSLTTTSPPATTGPTSAPAETETSGGTINTKDFGSKMTALVVAVAVFKM